MRCFQGIHYRNRWFYDLQNRLKLGRDHDLRFRIAMQYLKPGDSVLDVCSSFGQLKHFLPPRCHYRCIEASPDFAARLKRSGITVIVHDLHQGLPSGVKADAAVMIVSINQFRDTSAGELLEGLKKIAGRVIIVEDVLERARGENSFLQRMMNYFCQTEYYRPVELLTRDEFSALMQRHGYACRQYDKRYYVGSYGKFI
jgi:hypothetical protein